jgi:hypothetical protein
VKKDAMKTAADVADERLFDNWFDPIETELRTKVRGFIEAMVEEELEMALARPRPRQREYARYRLRLSGSAQSRDGALHP